MEHSPYLLFVSSVCEHGRKGVQEALQAGIEASDLYDPAAAAAFMYVVSYTIRYDGFPDKEIVRAETGTYLPQAPSRDLHFWIDKVCELRQHRGLLTFRNDLNKLVENHQTADAVEHVRRSAYELEKMGKSKAKTKPMDKLFASVVDRYVRIKNGERGVPTPWKTINEATLGLWPQDVIAFVARPGVGKCLEGSTPMVDPLTGRLCTLEEMYAEDRYTHVYSWSEEDGIHAREITAKIDTGYKRCLTFSFETGRSLTVTPEHPYLTPRGWVKAEDLNVGDTVALAGSLPEPVHAEGPPILDLASLAAAVVRACCEDLPIPDAVFQLPYAHLQVLLAMAWSACTQVESDPLSIRTRSLDYAARIQHLWQRLGILMCVSKDDDAYLVSVMESGRSRFVSLMQCGVLEPAPAVHWIQIEGVEDAGRCKIFDLTVEPTSCFVANDIVVHNTWLLSILGLHAQLAGKRVLFATTEMGEEEIAMRYWSLREKWSFGKLWRGELPPHQEERMFELLKQGVDFSACPYDVVGDDFDLNPATVRGAIEEAKPDLFILDGAYLLKTYGKTRNERHAEAFEEIKRISKSCKVPFAIASQLNREAEKDKGNRLGHMAFSDTLGQVASYVFFISKPDDGDLIRLDCEKGRHVPIPAFYANYNFQDMDFGEVQKAVTTPEDDGFVEADDTSLPF